MYITSIHINLCSSVFYAFQAFHPKLILHLIVLSVALLLQHIMVRPRASTAIKQMKKKGPLARISGNLSPFHETLQILHGVVRVPILKFQEHEVASCPLSRAAKGWALAF